MLCSKCLLPLKGGDEAALFICPRCGLAHEPGDGGLEAFRPLTAAMTTELAVAGPVQHLAVWRLEVSVQPPADSAWERIRKAALPGPGYLYVPAFSLMRPVVQRLGIALVEAQPQLELTPGLPADVPPRPSLVGSGSVAGESVEEGDRPEDAPATEPDFGPLSPVVVSREDARALSHFVYLAVESHEAHDLRSVDYRLEPTGEDLIFIPAVWDPRYIHESNWRLLLHEFDGLVA
ncbi:MAG: hypothetical protein A2W26_02750 [Acidobacteria bacterium RBG_16_64_8]|nr:MAG: hypothetical protein A2W26_02750 [Acidobacteria bacterium RBG_16_64_8]